MGNLISNIKTENKQTETGNNAKPASNREIMDYIATYYILTMDFNSLRKLQDKEYCDNLVIITSEIVEKYFTNMEITYLADDIKGLKDEVNDEVKDELKDELKDEVKEKDNVMFFKKSDLRKIDVENPIKKKRICNGIAKFYVKIAHVFAAILTTINPVYNYKDEYGDVVNATIYEKGRIPKDVTPEIKYLNICDDRINALKGDSKGLDGNEEAEITVQPRICPFHILQEYKDDSTVESEEEDVDNSTVESDEEEDTVVKRLTDEPGIPELMELYYDDNYDYETGKFTGMTEETNALFEENLKYFYSIFTDGKEKPDYIKKFSDIKLREYHNMPECNGKEPLLKMAINGKFSDENGLLKKYAENLKDMIKRAKDNQALLLDVLNKLFTYSTEEDKIAKRIRINPALTETSLQEVVLETRAIIVRLYLTCETDFTNGIKIYEALVEKKILETTENQLKTFTKMADKLVAESDIPNPAETKVLERIK